MDKITSIDLSDDIYCDTKSETMFLTEDTCFRFKLGKLHSITNRIADIKNLLHLNISYSLITELPLEICNLKKLSILDVKFTPLRRLPDRIGDLNLEKLVISGTDIDSLPLSLTQCHSLSHFACDWGLYIPFTRSYSMGGIMKKMEVAELFKKLLKISKIIQSKEISFHHVFEDYFPSISISDLYNELHPTFKVPMLTRAVREGSLGVVRSLLSVVFPPGTLNPLNFKDSNECTPLMSAIALGDLNMATLLLNGKPNINIPTRNGTALHIAAAMLDAEAIQMLLDANIDVEIRDQFGNTALHAMFTLPCNDPTIFRSVFELLVGVINPNCLNSNLLNPLLAVASSKSGIHTMELLLRIRSEQPLTCRVGDCEHSTLDILGKKYCARTIDIDFLGSPSYSTALHLALMNGLAANVHLLLAAGANPCEHSLSTAKLARQSGKIVWHLARTVREMEFMWNWMRLIANHERNACNKFLHDHDAEWSGRSAETRFHLAKRDVKKLMISSLYGRAVSEEQMANKGTLSCENSVLEKNATMFNNDNLRREILPIIPIHPYVISPLIDFSSFDAFTPVHPPSRIPTKSNSSSLIPWLRLGGVFRFGPPQQILSFGKEKIDYDQVRRHAQELLGVCMESVHEEDQSVCSSDIATNLVTNLRLEQFFNEATCNEPPHHVTIESLLQNLNKSSISSDDPDVKRDNFNHTSQNCLKPILDGYDSQEDIEFLYNSQSFTGGIETFSQQERKKGLKDNDSSSNFELMEDESPIKLAWSQQNKMDSDLAFSPALKKKSLNLNQTDQEEDLNSEAEENIAAAMMSNTRVVSVNKNRDELNYANSDLNVTEFNKSKTTLIEHLQTNYFTLKMNKLSSQSTESNNNSSTPRKKQHNDKHRQINNTVKDYLSNLTKTIDTITIRESVFFKPSFSSIDRVAVRVLSLSDGVPNGRSHEEHLSLLLNSPNYSSRKLGLDLISRAGFNIDISILCHTRTAEHPLQRTISNGDLDFLQNVLGMVGRIYGWNSAELMLKTLRDKFDGTALHLLAENSFRDMDLDDSDDCSSPGRYLRTLRWLMVTFPAILASLSNFIDRRGETALRHAVRSGNSRVVGTLLSLGADPNFSSPVDGFSAVHLSAARGDTTDGVLATLLSHPACDPNATSCDAVPVSPLALAATTLDFPSCLLLVNAGAVPYVPHPPQSPSPPPLGWFLGAAPACFSGSNISRVNPRPTSYTVEEFACLLVRLGVDPTDFTCLLAFSSPASHHDLRAIHKSAQPANSGANQLDGLIQIPLLDEKTNGGSSSYGSNRRAQKLQCELCLQPRYQVNEFAGTRTSKAVPSRPWPYNCINCGLRLCFNCSASYSPPCAANLHPQHVFAKVRRELAEADFRRNQILSSPSPVEESPPNVSPSILRLSQESGHSLRTPANITRVPASAFLSPSHSVGHSPAPQIEDFEVSMGSNGSQHQNSLSGCPYRPRAGRNYLQQVTLEDDADWLSPARGMSPPRRLFSSPSPTVSLCEHLRDSSEPVDGKQCLLPRDSPPVEYLTPIQPPRSSHMRTAQMIAMKAAEAMALPSTSFLCDLNACDTDFAYTINQLLPSYLKSSPQPIDNVLDDCSFFSPLKPPLYPPPIPAIDNLFPEAKNLSSYSRHRWNSSISALSRTISKLKQANLSPEQDENQKQVFSLCPGCSEAMKSCPNPIKFIPIELLCEEN